MTCFPTNKYHHHHKRSLKRTRREREKEERDCASQHRSSAYFSIKHTCCNTKHTHTFLKHTQTQCPLPQILLSTRPSRLIQRRKKSTSFSSPGGYVCSVNIPIGCVLIHSLLGEMQEDQPTSSHTRFLFLFFKSHLKHDRRVDLDEHIRPYQLALVSSSARAKGYPRPRLN